MVAARGEARSIIAESNMKKEALSDQLQREIEEKSLERISTMNHLSFYYRNAKIFKSIPKFRRGILSLRLFSLFKILDL